MKSIHKLQYLDFETSLNQTFHPAAILFGVESRIQQKLDEVNRFCFSHFLS